MQWLQDIDIELFRFINLTLMNPVCDVVMPVLSGNAVSNPIFFPLLVLAGAWLLFKGGTRGRVFLVLAGLTLAIGDGFICNTIKHAIARPRPFLTLPDVHCLAGQGGSGSLPSSHAANWFAAATLAFIYYRRSLWFMGPIAAAVSLSRIYNGVHYPSDVLAGALLGAGTAIAVAWSADWVWETAGKRWFPLWWRTLPRLLCPTPQAAEEEFSNAEPANEEPAPVEAAPHTTLDQHWLRLGYIVLGVFLVARLIYIASGTIELSGDEAYQWLWSKHLALSYYSKPPMIAYAQFMGTSLWGDNAFGVRFLSPVLGAILSLVTLRFFAREVNARAGFVLVLVVNATPLLAAGSVLMTVDPLSVFFWTAAMLAGWRAAQPNSGPAQWLWVGLWMGLGFLSKYTELFQLLSWAFFFALWPPARKHLRRPGPWLALLVNAILALPVLIWNYQHAWVTVSHVADTAGVGQPWKFTLKFLGEFLASEFALLNPVFFAGTVWAIAAFWRRGRHNARLVYFFSMGAPVFLAYLAHSIRGRVLPNWIAPGIIPLFCLMVIYWDQQWRLGAAKVGRWLAAGCSLGAAMVILSYNTDLTKKLLGVWIPVNYDPLHRLRVWSDVAAAAGAAREELLAEGKPVFIIANHYDLTGVISFYLPEARQHVSDTPLVYFKTSPRPLNQFYFWPGYTSRKGENAVFVQELDRDDPKPQPPPPSIRSEFESVKDMGVREVLYHGRLCRPIQVFACRGLK